MDGKCAGEAGHEMEQHLVTNGWVLGGFGPQTSVRISWMCKTQSVVSHSSAESEVISLDAGLRMKGVPALGLLDCWIVFWTHVHNPLLRVTFWRRSGERHSQLDSDDQM